MALYEMRHLLVSQAPGLVRRHFSYYITTPIFYVNSSPHVGHVHTVLLADAIARHHQLKTGFRDIIFSTGTDEHGIKVQNAADAVNMDYSKFCDKNSSKFRDLFKTYKTTLTDFVRTTETRHKETLNHVWNELDSRGFIDKRLYEGWYSSADETFVPPSQVVQKSIDGSVHHVDQQDNPLIWTAETNYVFKIAKVSDKVLEWLVTEKPVIPEKFNQEAIKMITQNENDDISISRPKTRVEWAHTVPGDPSQTIYVWLDALTNYLTVNEYPRTLKRSVIDCQVFGKDILKFHAIYWPAFLTALSLPRPKMLLCHSHWLIDSKKMSKSKGNVVDPIVENQRLTPEGLRYFLLRAGTNHSDNNYDRTLAFRRVTSELVNTYSNTLGRVSSPKVNPLQQIPKVLYVSRDQRIHDEDTKNLLTNLNGLRDACDHHFDKGDFYLGLEEIMKIIRQCNVFIDHKKPWSLAGNSSDDDIIALSNVVAVCFEVLRVCSILLQPVIPCISEKALNIMNCENRGWADASVQLEFRQYEDQRSHESKKIVSGRIFERSQLTEK